MSDLNDFLKAISVGKKEAIDSNPGKKALKQLGESLHATNPFLGLTVKTEPVEVVQEQVAPAPAIEVVGEFLMEDGVFANQQLTEVVVPEVKPAAEQVPMDKINKYLSRGASFQQPDPEVADPTIRALQDKLKFLEQAIGKIAATGPGSGEVNFRYLDDVNRATLTPDNDNWLVEYDAATKKMQTTENVGPIRTLRFNTAGPQTPLLPGQLGWNVEEDCLDIGQADGSTLQSGLEQYFQIHNTTGSTLLNGEVVMFAGVDEESHTNPIPLAQKYVANSTAVPLYIVGVMTNDVPNQGHGRATTFGKVRNLDTTGSSVGETWAKGDLLWAHPTMPGKLTKVRPTAPDVATSIAAVLQVNAVTGILLVRPTIWPRLFYGDWYSTTSQTHALANTPYRMSLEHTGAASGFTNSAGLITAQNAGLYNFQFSLQVISTNSSAAYYYIWYRKNGVDAPNSATKVSISSNSVVLAPSWNFPVSMQIGDTFELMWACDTPNKVSVSAQAATSFCPAIPSIILTVQQVNL